MNKPLFKKDPRKTLGSAGEEAACAHLRRNGYEILERNYRCRLGEIDVIARKSERISFVEIKTRAQSRFGRPEESVTRRKQQKIVKIAQWYLKDKKWLEKPVSFDVIAVFREENKPLRIQLIAGAF